MGRPGAGNGSSVRVRRGRVAQVLGVFGLLLVGTVLYAVGADNGRSAALRVHALAEEQLPTGCRLPADLRRRLDRTGEPIRNGAGGRPKRVALGFDDGPSGYTREIVDILDRHEARATFFVLGVEAERRPGKLRHILSHGHELGNHSYSHTNFVQAGVPAMEEEIEQTNSVVEAETGYMPCTFRPPMGATDATLVRAAAALDMATVTWDVDPADWDAPRETIKRSLLDEVSSGSIVVVHDGGGDRAETMAALPRFLRALDRRGYELVTVSELLGLQPTLR